jgi:GWxTD domain-containing protein
MRTLSFVVMLLCLCLSQGIAQHPQGPEMQSQMFLEPSVLPAPDSATWLVSLSYRIDRTMFVAVRNTDSLFTGSYRRTGEVVIELTDSAGVPFGRRLDRIDRSERNAPTSAPTAERQWEQGVAPFAVPPGSYRFYFEATDAESQRRQTRKDIIIRTPERSKPLPLISGGTFVEAPSAGSHDTLSFDNYGGDFPFGKQHSLLLGLRLGDDTSSTLKCRWSFKVLDFDKEKARTIEDSALALPVIRTGGIALAQLRNTVGGVFLPTNGQTVQFALIPTATAMLPLRDFVFSIEVTTGGGKQMSYSMPFRAVWPEMPFSLKNVDGAIEALRFITTGSQLDSLRKGSFEQRRDALEAFWQQKNQNAGSARNEVMAEYYRRVDYAIRSFGSLRIPDGSRSDRGKIYILYGPSSRIARQLNPTGGHMETWYYDRLKKKFVFLDENKNGMYALVSTAPL